MPDDTAPTIKVPLSAEDLHTLIYALEMAPNCDDIGLGVHLVQYLINVEPAPDDLDNPRLPGDRDPERPTPEAERRGQQSLTNSPLTDDISAKRREIEP